jgi:hypothetical protein
MPNSTRASSPSVTEIREGVRRPNAALLPHAFAPVHKRALGMAVGTVSGLALFTVTAFHIVLPPAGGLPIHLLAQFFYGYEVTWWGALLGFLWGFFTGFVAGWFVAFVHNLATAIMVFFFKTRGVLAQTKDFLDHI